MIDPKTLELPTIIEELSYENILALYVTVTKAVLFEKLGIDWQPLDSDDFSLVLQSIAYRELHIRNEINEKFRQLFLAYATKSNLDHRALEYDIERLKGSKPYDTYEFKISEIQQVDLTIDAGLVLTDDSSQYEAILKESVIIPAGELSVDGIVELTQEMESLDIKTEVVTKNLPYVLTAKSKGGRFANGANPENDEKLLYRVLLSFADKSTAGSEETYKSYTYKADERIEDVKVYKGLYDIQEYAPQLEGADLETIKSILSEIESSKGTVEVYYYSSKADALMQSRIEEQLNDQKTRPLSDIPLVLKASEVSFVVDAELKLFPNQDKTLVLSNANESLKKGLKELRTIGEEITRSEINKFLKVDGVKEVIINIPSQNVAVSKNEIGINDEPNNNITTTDI